MKCPDCKGKGMITYDCDLGQMQIFVQHVEVREK